MRNYAIAGGRHIRFIRNAYDRVTTRCAEGCEWYFHSSWMQVDKTFQCKALISTHSCARTFKNPLMTSSWLAKKYLEKLRDNPDWSITDFRNKVSDDYVVRVSRSQAYNAKKKALEIVNGKHTKQFKKIWDYTHALLRSNEGSTIKLLTDTPSIPNALPIF